MPLFAKLPALNVRRLARFLAVVAIAMAAGHLAQTLAAHKPAPHVAAIAKPTDIVQLSSSGSDRPAASLPRSVDPMSFIETVSTAATNLPTPFEPAVATVAPCTDSLALQAQPAGLISVQLSASCHELERVVLHHAGLAVTGKVGTDGTLTMVVPALTAAGTVDILFADGSRVSQSVAVPEAATLRRFGVQWQGTDAFVVHGFENGADYGQTGDITLRNPGVPTDDALGAGGFLTTLGDGTVDNPLLAQVYTYPANPALHSDVVVEAAVTNATCGHDLLGQAITAANDHSNVTDLTLAMPDCSGVGDFLVLKNLASDLKIAAN